MNILPSTGCRMMNAAALGVNGPMDCIVLDARGVIFEAADDVAELLIPFVKEHGGDQNEDLINNTYLSASLGDISANDFWHVIGLDPNIENSYLARHKLTKGLIEFLGTAKDMGIPVWLLSNDVDRWSEKLRCTYNIDQYLHGAIVSGFARSRKPDMSIYQVLIEKSGYAPKQMRFFDDRQKNILSAESLGIPSVLFNTAKGFSGFTGSLRAGTL